MKNKKILAILTISAIISAAATGCSFGGDEPEEQVVVTETPAPEATATPTHCAKVSMRDLTDRFHI